MYYAKVELIDAAIGQVLTALRQTNQHENTWIVFSSDHGEMLGDHGMMGKIAFLEKSIHVPLIMRPPRTLSTEPYSSWRCTGLTDQLDVTASLCEMAGLPASGPHGQSLANKVTAGDGAPDADRSKEHVVVQVGPLPGRERYHMIRTQSHKLVTQARRAIELYDLVNDPAETENRVRDLTLQNKLRELGAILRDLMASGSIP